MIILKKKLLLLIPAMPLAFLALTSCGVNQTDELNKNVSVTSPNFVHSHPVTKDAPPAKSNKKTAKNEREPVPFNEIPPAPPLSVEQAIASIEVQPGFVLENVVAEPNIFTPVALAFDGDGRIWVAEMNTFMPDVKGNNEEIPEGNIALLEDSNGDGSID
jgi:hypothetical protein